jgi:hypothetical protein
MDEASEWTCGDYPTDAALERLATWPHQDVAGALDFAKAIWHWPDFARHELDAHETAILHAAPDDKFLRLATGGWSGNEEIVRALNCNLMIRALAWRLHARGGLHIYQYPKQSEPHTVGTDEPTPENDPIGRFRS